MALFCEKLSLRISDGVPSEVAPVGDEVPSCWICHEEGADGEGKPLRRDCSCRCDTASFAHLSCLVEYAKYKTENRRSHESWKVCPQCLQLYQNELAVELATELVSFVEEQHQDDQSKSLSALDLKLHVLASQRAHREEAKQIANTIVSTIESMKVADPSLPQYVRMIEARAYNVLGVILYREGTKEGVRVALEYYEKAKCMSGLPAAGRRAIERNIAAAKQMYEGGSQKNKDEAIKVSQRLYEQCVSEHGEVHRETVGIGLCLVFDLRNGNRSMEAEEMLAKLLVSCKLLHGPEHERTKRAEAHLRECVRANQTTPRTEANGRFLIEPKTLIISALISLALWSLKEHLSK